MKSLDKLFNPNTIAVIGASSDEQSVGHALFKNLIHNDFTGIVYPVNLKRKSVLGIKTYPNIKSIPDDIDLAIIITPAQTVPAILEECGQAKVKAAVIISSGFKENGKEGEKRSKEISKISKKYGIRLLGPNCLGFIRPKLSLNASFGRTMTEPGKIAFISQSGALGTAILDWASERHLNFSYFVSLGEMLDVNFDDLIDYFGNDPETTLILIYMESLTNARKFLSAARAHSRNKPIVVLKAGKSKEGAKAAKSHTGSIAGDDDIYDAAFKRAGIIRVDTIRDLFNNAQTINMQPRPRGRRLAIITNAGGPGVIATDALIKLGGQLAQLSSDTIIKMDKFLPSAWSKGNPVDMLGDAGPDRYFKTLKEALNDKNIDGILIILTPQAMTDPVEIANQTVKAAKKSEKTILASWMGAGDMQEGIHILEKGNIPYFKTPEDAVQSFMYMYKYAKNLETLYETPASIPHAFTPQTQKNKLLLAKVINESRYTLTEAEAKELLSNYDIPVTKNAIVTSAKEAGEMAAKIGWPVVMKLSSPDIFHKIDVGGVKLNVNSSVEAIDAYNSIIKNAKKHRPDARIHGVFIEAMIKKRYELLIGCKKDPLFGPAIVFGMGGVAVEVFKDTNIGLPPLNMALAKQLIEDTKIYNLLKGYRGIPGVDISAIQFLLYKFAYLLADFPEIKELDINPFAVDENGGVVLDAKVFLDENIVGREIEPYSHLVISPYPKEYIIEKKLPNGQKVFLRPIRPEDEIEEEELIKTFSEKTIINRFFKKIDLNHDLLTRFTQIDYDREMAIIAEINDKDKKRFTGVARMIAESDNENAEITLAVGDPWQGKGYGSMLIDYMLQIAKQRKIKKVWIKFLKDNEPMLNLTARRGFKIEGNGKILKAEKKI